MTLGIQANSACLQLSPVGAIFPILLIALILWLSQKQTGRESRFADKGHTAHLTQFWVQTTALGIRSI